MIEQLFKTYEKWINPWFDYLCKTWGLNRDFARKIALLIILFSLYNIKFVITSGYRSIEKQEELYRRWLAGDPTVLTPALPGKSLHNNTSWLGNADALACDIDTSNPPLAGAIAKALFLYWAGTKDRVHFASYPG